MAWEIEPGARTRGRRDSGEPEPTAVEEDGSSITTSRRYSMPSATRSGRAEAVETPLRGRPSSGCTDNRGIPRERVRRLGMRRLRTTV